MTFTIRSGEGFRVPANSRNSGVATCEQGEMAIAGGVINGSGATCGVMASFREDTRTWRVSVSCGAQSEGFGAQVTCVSIT